MEKIKGFANLQEELEGKSAQEVIEWALKNYAGKVALASSFGAEDVVLIDLMVKIDPKARVFTLDTGRLHQETYDVIESVRNKYQIPIEFRYPDAWAVEEMETEHGPNLFYRSVELRKLCCGVRKVDPLNQALSSLSGWICGLRRAQSVTRTELKKLEIDEAHGSILKINPIADWSEEQVWSHTKENNVPYNKLHDQGFPSIGCAPCTRAVEPGEDLRAGRWWWENPESKECGLHVKAESEK